MLNIYKKLNDYDDEEIEFSMDGIVVLLCVFITGSGTALSGHFFGDGSIVL